MGKMEVKRRKKSVYSYIETQTDAGRQTVKLLKSPLSAEH